MPETRIDILLNGKEAATNAATVAQLLAELRLEGQRVAVLLNGEVARRAVHDSTALKPNDVVEVVTLVGGG